MSDTVIRVENLSKKYILSHQQEGQKYKALRDVMADSAKAVGKKLLKPSSKTVNSIREEFWALKDVSFEIKQGDRVGIIGRNGAGKSTLLKVLSRIVEPTSGSIGIRGRVASLLEVGTGFHAELTGRENVYLNGAILGMSREEIKRKFDEIVAFAEVEKFLDTPVKRYSSGMYVRLAFSVAAHLEPEILIVDEVLAVGDANFQKKCLGKMQDVSKNQGRTILFVSHNSDAIQRLCSKCLMLERGQVAAYGDMTGVMSRYLSSSNHQASPIQWFDLSSSPRVRGNKKAQFTAIHYNSTNKAVAFNPYPDGPLEFSVSIESEVPQTVGSFALTLYDQNGAKLVNADTLSTGQVFSLQRGKNLVNLTLKQLHLNPGIYILGLWLSDPLSNTIFDHIESAFEMEVVDPGFESLGARSSADGVVTSSFEFSLVN
ncbi:MAG: ATP-binding cassette domain-containing protein [Tildeniella nuda ZEHNDER 1965/U140]|jgi:lipopolysaccharide transport system ATP-binding protein|nr:ATP-binding cassette domain-containing protein [Tildeniella nuda ZEHNDER 1965/U140]